MQLCHNEHNKSSKYSLSSLTVSTDMLYTLQCIHTKFTAALPLDSSPVGDFLPRFRCADPE